MIQVRAVQQIVNVGLLLTAALVVVGADGGVQAPGPQPPTTSAVPRLVVMIVVDQFRADYVDWYGSQWTKGLHEIFTKGAYFAAAAYPYAATVTCAGHATIGTGALPSKHGMIHNEWFDRSSHSFVMCTEDPAAQSISLATGAGTEHHSAKWLLIPTFGEELKRQSRGATRIVSMSGKARSAIGMAGHGGPNSIIVWEEDDGTWATSSALTRSASPEVKAYMKSQPILATRGQRWDRVLPESAYLFADKAPGEPADATFPHFLDEPIRTSRTSPTFTSLWDRTPFVDAYLGGLAGDLTERLQLGRRSGTDFIGIGFSGLDIEGHTYGPRSHEVQDTLARLDQTLGTLIDILDRTVGRNQYVLALSADHGVAFLPEQAEPSMSAGRVSSLLPVGAAVEAVLDRRFGPSSYVEAIAGNYLYFQPGIVDRIRSNSAATKEVETAALGIRGIAHVYWSADLATTGPTDDGVLEKARKSYMKGRSGDLLIIPRPYWVSGATGTNHGSPYDYDTRVPVAFLGAGVAPGRYTTAVSPGDIAPTLASLTRVTLAQADGRVLGEALVSQRH